MRTTVDGPRFVLSHSLLDDLTTGVLAELLIRIYYDRGEVSPYHTTAAPEQAPDEGWHHQA